MIIKTEEEKERLLNAGAKLREVLDLVGSNIKPGVTATELDKIAYDKILSFGAKPAFLNYKPSGAEIAFPATLCVSVNDEVVHGIPASRETPIQEGDIVSVDCGLELDGMFVDAAHTVIAGGGDDEARRLVETTKKALANALVVAHAGNTVGDIGSAVETVARESNYVTPPELGGHGLGTKQHEEPFIPNVGDPGTGETLVEGMVLAIEPIMFEGFDPRIKLAKDRFTYVTKDKSRAAHFEHTIIVTKQAPIIATGPMW